MHRNGLWHDELSRADASSREHHLAHYSVTWKRDVRIFVTDDGRLQSALERYCTAHGYVNPLPRGRGSRSPITPILLYCTVPKHYPSSFILRKFPPTKMRFILPVLAALVAVTIAAPTPDPKKPGDIYKRHENKRAEDTERGDIPWKRGEATTETERGGIPWKREEASTDTERGGIPWKREEASTETERGGIPWKREDATTDTERGGIPWKRSRGGY